ncbi:MAG: phosphoribosylformylglycinamidine synthase subunit PurQ [Desulfarculaceae bacterium]|nr:phosphoribosylformylglycinamidine synthase subunit PurQ [Desulfarculaceae bacterium]
MTTVNALVLTGFGLNCDMETAYAFKLAGAEASRVHINSLIHGKERLEEYHVLAFGGGFSWGDDHGAGVVQALKMKNHLGDELASFVEKGGLVLGICNGFQTLVNLGLLPALEKQYTERSTSITWNDCGNFRDQWVRLSGNSQSPCVYTKGIQAADFPVRHGEGKFVAPPEVLESLSRNNQIVFRYADESGNPAAGKFPLNPNGSTDDIAGICDPTGRVFGLMPHPEAYNHFTNHPDWTRQKSVLKRKEEHEKADELFKTTPVGIRLFENAVAYVKEDIL